MILPLIIFLCVLQINSSPLKWISSSTCWNGNKTCDPPKACFNLTAKWPACVCPPKNTVCSQFFGDVLEKFTPRLLGMNEPCGRDSTSIFTMCQLHLKCFPMDSQGEGVKYICRCEGGVDYKCLESLANTTTVSPVFFKKIDEQCDGKNYTGTKQCERGLECFKRSESLSVCLCPDETRECRGTTMTTFQTITTTASKEISQTPSTTVTVSPLRKHGEQCGGKDYGGGTQCEPPFECVYQETWSSTCLCSDPNNRNWCEGMPNYKPTTATSTTPAPTTNTAASTKTSTTPAPTTTVPNTTTITVASTMSSKRTTIQTVLLPKCKLCGFDQRFKQICPQCLTTQDHCTVICNCYQSGQLVVKRIDLSSYTIKGCLLTVNAYQQVTCTVTASNCPIAVYIG